MKCNVENGNKRDLQDQTYQPKARPGVSPTKGAPHIPANKLQPAGGVRFNGHHVRRDGARLASVRSMDEQTLLARTIKSENYSVKKMQVSLESERGSAYVQSIEANRCATGM
jgi:hypothetical protein